MTDRPDSCQHPDDVEGCCQSLIQAWREKRLAQHCMIEGLRKDCRDCEAIMLAGLYPEAQKGKASARLTDRHWANDLEAACEEIVILGYALGLDAAQETFVEAYEGLVGQIIGAHKLRDHSEAQDAFQVTFVGLHRHFSKPGRTMKHGLRPYVCKAARNTCKSIQADRWKWFGQGRVIRLEEGLAIDGTPAYLQSDAPIPDGVLECWEAADEHLRETRRRSLVDRIILAGSVVESQRTDKKYAAPQVLAHWNALREQPDEQLVPLYMQVVATRERSPSHSVVRVLAELVNRGEVDACHVPIVYLAADGLTFPEARDLFVELSEMPTGTIASRLSRSKALIRSS